MWDDCLRNKREKQRVTPSSNRKDSEEAQRRNFAWIWIIFYLGVDLLSVFFLSALSSICWLGDKGTLDRQEEKSFWFSLFKKKKQHHCITVMFLLRRTRVMVHFIQQRKYIKYRKILSCYSCCLHAWQVERTKPPNALFWRMFDLTRPDFDGILHFRSARGVSSLLGGGEV